MTFYHIDEEPQFPPVQQVVLEIRCERTITRNYAIVKYHTISSVGRILINAQKIPFPRGDSDGFLLAFTQNSAGQSSSNDLVALSHVCLSYGLWRGRRHFSDPRNTSARILARQWTPGTGSTVPPIFTIPSLESPWHSFLRWINFKRKLLLFEQVIFLYEWKSSSKIFNSKFY